MTLVLAAGLCGWAALQSCGAAVQESGGTATVSEGEATAADSGASSVERPPAGVRKKGIGHWSPSHGKHGLDPVVIDELGCGWFYNWTPRPRAAAQKVEAEFIPMIWGESNVSDEALAGVKAGGYSALLGFNEPDSRGQANISVARAIELWPKLMATGLSLGSPGTTQGARWLDEFMEEADRRGYRVDFICLHWYDDITRPDAVENLRRYLTRYWERYKRPLWLTEFSGGDWEWCSRRPVTFEDNARFAREVIPMLESLPFVERYAWFSSKVTPSDRYYPTTGLYESADKITVVGAAYRDADKRAEAAGPE
ncbi:MAG: RNA polymerase [Armatimonadota bacterium]|nr:MAG: RNA polymerase [Armatimonadota bacterium]